MKIKSHLDLVQAKQFCRIMGFIVVLSVTSCNSDEELKNRDMSLNGSRNNESNSEEALSRNSKNTSSSTNNEARLPKRAPDEFKEAQPSHSSASGSNPVGGSSPSKTPVAFKLGEVGKDLHGNLSLRFECLAGYTVTQCIDSVKQESIVLSFHGAPSIKKTVELVFSSIQSGHLINGQWLSIFPMDRFTAIVGSIDSFDRISVARKSGDLVSVANIKLPKTPIGYVVPSTDGLKYRSHFSLLNFDQIGGADQSSGKRVFKIENPVFVKGLNGVGIPIGSIAPSQINGFVNDLAREFFGLDIHVSEAASSFMILSGSNADNTQRYSLSYDHRDNTINWSVVFPGNSSTAKSYGLAPGWNRVYFGVRESRAMPTAGQTNYDSYQKQLPRTEICTAVTENLDGVRRMSCRTGGALVGTRESFASAISAKTTVGQISSTRLGTIDNILHLGSARDVGSEIWTFNAPVESGDVFTNSGDGLIGFPASSLGRPWFLAKNVSDFETNQPRDVAVFMKNEAFTGKCPFPLIWDNGSQTVDSFAEKRTSTNPRFQSSYTHVYSCKTGDLKLEYVHIPTQTEHRVTIGGQFVANGVTSIELLQFNFSKDATVGTTTQTHLKLNINEPYSITSDYVVLPVGGSAGIEWISDKGFQPTALGPQHILLRFGETDRILRIDFQVHKNLTVARSVMEAVSAPQGKFTVYDTSGIKTSCRSVCPVNNQPAGLAQLSGFVTANNCRAVLAEYESSMQGWKAGIQATVGVDPETNLPRCEMFSLIDNLDRILRMNPPPAYINADPHVHSLRKIVKTSYCFCPK